ncbi:MAG: putative alginate O-acetyltransferase [Bacteroidetes bacterium]|nr:putative alginate O-acetyltransferase [Bacteroidota bacterium]
MNWNHISSFFGTLFSFDDKYPLLFTQFYFWAFFAIVFAVFALIGNRIQLRNAFLFFMSMLFYYKTSGLFLILLIVTTLICYYSGKKIDQATKQSTKKWFLVFGVVVNLGILAYFKYAYFFTEVYNSMFHSDLKVVNYIAQWTNNATHSNYFDASRILLPVGISFYTFQSISYVIDVYRGRLKHVTNFFDFGFFVTFFPQLVAGPIVRANQFIPQLYNKFHLTKRQFGFALFWILNGLLKKIILSDYIAVNFVDRVFDHPLLFTSFENLFALFGYSLQVYADFSGYTDIAIGVAMLMGFYLPINFDSPYKATNPGSFWRRWHISLSTWLKDYLYIPLGGNRKGKFRTNLNLMITMLLGGLWHGASWNFVIWGGLNGSGILVFKWWKKLKKYQKTVYTAILFLIFIILQTKFQQPAWMIGAVWSGIIFFGTLIDHIYNLIFSQKPLKWINRGWSIFLTFVFITFTRLFFRSGSNLDPVEANSAAWNTAKNMVKQIGGKWDLKLIPEIISTYKYVVILFILGMIIHWLPAKWKQWYRINFALLPVWAMGIIVVVAVFIVYQFITADLQPFIYFQF